jgi:hypothetical protein
MKLKKKKRKETWWMVTTLSVLCFLQKVLAGTKGRTAIRRINVGAPEASASISS